MASPVNGPNQGNAEQELKARIKMWIREEMANAARGGIGLHVDGATGNLIIDNGDVQSGNYAPGSAGWALQPTGAAELGSTTVRGGNMQSGNYVAGSAGWALNGAGNAEFNQLTLRSGIIGNDALTSPVVPGWFYAQQSSVSVPQTTWTTVTTQTITVPAGFTKAVVSANAHVVINGVVISGGANAQIRSRIIINGNTGLDSGQMDGLGEASSAFGALLTGLTGGGTFTVTQQAYVAGFSGQTYSTSWAVVEGPLTWYR